MASRSRPAASVSCAQPGQSGGQLLAPDAQGMPAVAAPGRPADRGALWPPMWMGMPPGSHGASGGCGRGRSGRTPRRRWPPRARCRPTGPACTSMHSSVRRPRRGEVDPAGLELLAHPAHPDAQPDPALRQGVQGGQSLGHDHGMVGGEDEDAGGRAPSRVVAAARKAEDVDGIGDGAVVGQRHPPRRGVGVAAGVVADHHRVLDQDDGLEATVLGVPGEADHPVGIGAHPGAHGREHGEFQWSRSTLGHGPVLAPVEMELALGEAPRPRTARAKVSV